MKLEFKTVRVTGQVVKHNLYIDGERTSTFSVRDNLLFYVIDELSTFYVFRRKGYMRALLQNFLTQCDKEVRLQVYAVNLPARALYKDLGFVEVTETDDTITDLDQLDPDWMLELSWYPGLAGGGGIALPCA